MLTFTIICVDLLLQGIAALLAVRLIRLTGKATAWTCISLAFVVMALARCYSLYQWVALGIRHGMAMEIFKLVISGLLLAGVALIGQIFRQHAEATAQLHQSEEKYRTIVETAHEGIIVVDDQDRITYTNPRISEIFGFSSSELLGQSATAYLGEEEKVLVQGLREQSLQGSSGVLELPLPRKDGENVWALVSTSPILSLSGQYLGGIGMISDLSARRRVEEELRQSEQKLRFLASHLLGSQEKERQKISQELHEDLGQTLQAVKMQTAQIKQRLPADQPDLCQECDQLLSHLHATIDRVRSLAWQYWPNMLEDLGLLASLRHLLADFCRHYGLQDCQTDFDEVGDLLPPGAQLSIFRIFQAALSNIREHSRARRLLLAIKQQPAGIDFRIEDDGQGFDVAAIRSQPDLWDGLGLYTIDARVKDLGGSLQIDSHAGQGTSLRFTLPVPGAAGPPR